MSPKLAQALARHSNIRLTLGVYTHVGLHDRTAAIGALPEPPAKQMRGNRLADEHSRTAFPTFNVQPAVVSLSCHA